MEIENGSPIKFSIFSAFPENTVKILDLVVRFCQLWAREGGNLTTKSRIFAVFLKNAENIENLQSPSSSDECPEKNTVQKISQKSDPGIQKSQKISAFKAGVADIKISSKTLLWCCLKHGLTRYKDTLLHAFSIYSF